MLQPTPLRGAAERNVRRHAASAALGAINMTDGCSRSVPKPMRRSVRWTSFVGAAAEGRRIRGLHEDGNPEHRVRVEHNRDTMLVHISDEDGQGWTTVAIDRATREWAVAQRKRQLDAAQSAYGKLYITSEGGEANDA